jgi:hypothetical protein
VRQDVEARNAGRQLGNAHQRILVRNPLWPVRTSSAASLYRARDIRGRQVTCGGVLPPAVRRFIEARIDSIEQLEIVLLLYRYPERSWTARDIADTLRLSPRAAARDLEMLARRNLLDVRLGDTVRYRYAPAVPELAAAARAVAECYRDKRTEIVALVAARGRRSLRDFADAFRITKDRDDG